MKPIEKIEKYLLVYRETKNNQLGYSLQIIASDIGIHTKRRLIYIVLFRDEIIYVGEAKSSLKTRFDRSFDLYRYFKRSGKARRGYKGYKWIELLENKKTKLTVWAIIFDKTYDENDKGIEIKAIEGELVYLIRNRTGKWPQYQNEIHFQNIKGAKEIAEYILKKII